MRGLYGGGEDALVQALLDARQRTLALYGHLDVASLQVPQVAIVNPPIWELSHIAWFQEHWCLRGGRRERPTLLPDADAFFDSSAVAHDTRWSLPYPPWARLRRYMDDTLHATLEALDATPPQERYFFELSLLHEDMHGEALAMTLQTLSLPAPAFAREPEPCVTNAARDVRFEGGEFELGTPRRADRFVFDNEKWSHRVQVEPFAMASEPVTQGEFRAFVEEGGPMPAHWRRDGDAWQVRRFDQWVALDPAAPMLHVSQQDALAYCAWAGRRLPTEREWEFAASDGGCLDPYPWGGAERALANLDMRHSAPGSDAREPPSAGGLRRMIGSVWEWTASPFTGYPGFAPDPYRDYSAPWFDTHFVLRGGSFATRSRLVHNRFRNFYLPYRADVFAGFRTCSLQDSGKVGGFAPRQA